MHKLPVLVLALALLPLAACSTPTAASYAPRFSALPPLEAIDQGTLFPRDLETTAPDQGGPATRQTLTLPLDDSPSAYPASLRRNYLDLGALLQDNPLLEVTVAAHTWAVGREDTNLALTQERAEAIKADLVARFGIAPGRITALGYGGERPVASNGSPEGRRANQRIQVSVSGRQLPSPAPESEEELLTLYFPTGGRDVTGLMDQDRQRLARYLAEHPGTEVVVQGHTDDVGQARDNLLLSLKRADSVRAAILHSLNLEPERVQAIGFGENLPAADNALPQGRELNRRVTVVARSPRPDMDQDLARAGGPRPPAAPEPPLPGARCAVLLYHGVDLGTRYSVSSRLFEEQLDALAARGDTVISMDDLAAYLRGERAIPERSVVITFDDGWKSTMRAFHILEQRNLPFTLFVTLETVGLHHHQTMLDAQDLRELSASPLVTFACHSYGHSQRLAARPSADSARTAELIRRDTAQAKQRFRELFGFDTPYFAFPYGAYSDEYTAQLNAAGFNYLFTVHFQAADRSTDPNRIPRFSAHDLSAAEVAALPDYPPDAPQTTARQGRLFVRTDPGDAAVRILGDPTVLCQGVELSQGEYLIETSRPGYITQVQHLRLSPDQDNTLRVDLVRRTTLTALAR